MKKYIFLIYIFVFLVSFSCVYGANSIVISPQSVTVNGVEKSFEVYNIDGNNFFKLRDIAYVLNGTSSQFSVDYNNERKIIEAYTAKAYKEVGGEMSSGEDKSSTAIQSSQKLLINDVQKDLTAYNIGGNNFFKLRELGNELNFVVDYDEAKNQVIIKSNEVVQIANITNVVAKISNEIPYVEITSESPIDAYNTFMLEEPDRIILDISNSNLEIDKKEIDVNYGVISKIRIGNQGDNVNRIVLDLDKSCDYKVFQTTDKLVTYISLSSNFSLDDINTPKDNNLLVYNSEGIPNVSDVSELDNTVDNVDINEDEIEIVKEDTTADEITEEMLADRIKITSIKYSSSTDKIKVTGKSKIEFEDFTLTEPNRIVIDFKNAVLDVDGPTSITPNNKNITSIRFSQKDPFVVRVVIDVKMIGDYEVVTKDKTIEITVEDMVPGELKYEELDDYSTLTLYNVKKKAFSITESSRYNTYTLKYSSSDFAPEKDTLKIENDYIEDIQITSSKIVISGNGDTKFSIKQNEDNVVVKIYDGSVEEDEEDEEDEKNNFVVLLDAGHGGSDPGACNGDDYEKVYNLAIMLKLKELLEDTDGITVYASRTTDKYIDRDGRIGFATAYDDADLYVSIHNNSSSNKSYDGTLVMYHNGDYEKDYGITSKEVAEIVLKELVDDLGTRSWGVRDPLDQVWVLYYSELPSIMCEVSFMSNDAELARLKTEEFQDTAAQAIYNGIMKAKDKMEK